MICRDRRYGWKHNPGAGTWSASEPPIGLIEEGLDDLPLLFGKGRLRYRGDQRVGNLEVDVQAHARAHALRLERPLAVEIGERTVDRLGGDRAGLGIRNHPARIGLR